MRSFDRAVNAPVEPHINQRNPDNPMAAKIAGLGSSSVLTEPA